MPWASLTWLSDTFSYDHLNRLLTAQEGPYSASGNLWSQGFAYDAFGNMSLSSNSGMPLSGITPVTSQNPINAANNRLIAGTYEPRGNLTGIGGVTMAYDGESRQNYIQDSGTSISYLYDGLGQRAEKQVAAGATTIYVHDAFGNLAAEYDSVNITPACTTCYLSYDHLGSVRLVTDENNQIVAQHDFAPFGVEIPSADRTVSTGTNYFGASANLTQMFTGQETDGGTATLDYFNARHFSAVLGSMTQPDPINAGGDIMNPQSWNAYAYVLGNPLGLVDPSGMDPQCGPGRYFTGEGCSGPPSGLTDGQNNYVNVVVIPGFMSGVNSKYPAPVSTPFPSGLTSATIFFGNDTARQVALSAQSVPGADDPPVGLDIWKGQQNLWSNTAGFGNSLTLGTAAVVAAPFALQSAG